jgi:hypothetical protein
MGVIKGHGGKWGSSGLERNEGLELQYCGWTKMELKMTIQVRKRDEYRRLANTSGYNKTINLDIVNVLM